MTPIGAHYRFTEFAQDMSHPYQAYYAACLANSLARYQERVGEAFPAAVEIACVDDGAFWAYARESSGRMTIDVAAGALDRIQDVWGTVLSLSAALPPQHQIELVGHQDHAIETSFAWLLQHELNHRAIGHFEYTEGAGLSEGQSPFGFGIARRVETKPSKLDALTEKEQAELHLCFEMQADHDATEIVLGAYSAENWPLFRYYAICILVVIFIIEAEERCPRQSLRYHPFAATRLFQLIAHLVEMPVIPGIKRAHVEGLEHLPSEYLPPASELAAYRTDVVSPIMAASQIIAEACGVPEAWKDLGTAEAYFTDIDSILIDQASDSDDFETHGARQWAELKPFNSKYLRKLGW